MSSNQIFHKRDFFLKINEASLLQIYFNWKIANFVDFYRHFLPSFAACSKNKDQTSCEKDDSTSKYSSAKIPNRNIAASGEFLLTVYNPSGSHGM